GAKSLRGGKMEDVIFAGTSGRSELGRAEVELTIDNTDGALPIEYAEVTISRTMFRNGGSEYAINGSSCRLLDVQELLSDSGIGREMHVIVGQGQLDTVLQATPEERRGFVEEAAGVLKHRKRKEKALRKLEAMQGNLTRVQDLTSELRRQLGPLGKQAELARRASTIQATLRDARLRLLADDLVQATSELDREAADEAALRNRQAEVTEALEAARAAETQAEADLQAVAPRLTQAQDAWYRLSGLRERVQGTKELAEERRRHLAEPTDPSATGPDPAELDEQARAARADEAELQAETETSRAALAEAVEQRTAAETAEESEGKRLAGLERAAADRREGVARLAGQVDGMRRRVTTAEEEVERLTQARDEARERAQVAQREFTALENQIAGLTAGEEDLDSEHERAQSALDEAEQSRTELEQAERDAERERATVEARHEALVLGLSRKDGSGAVAEAGDRVPGVLGSLSTLVTVESGWEAAVAIALADTADAVAVATVDDAAKALEMLRSDDLGRADLLVATDDGSPPDRDTWPQLPAGAYYVVDLLDGPDDLEPALQERLDRVAAVEDLPAARDLVAQLPGIVAVTRDGDLLGPTRASGGSSAAPSLLEVQASVDEAARRLEVTTARAEELAEQLARARERRDEAAAAQARALGRLHESDAEMTAVADQLGRLGDQARSSAADAERYEQEAMSAQQNREEAASALADLEARLAAAEDVDSEDEPATDERDRLAELARHARAGETEARLALRTSEERVRALSGKADSLEQAAAEERANRVRAEQIARRRERASAIAADVAADADRVLHVLVTSLAAAHTEREAAQAARSEHEHAVTQARERVRTLGAELDEITSTVHRDELARAEQRMRVETLQSKAVEELGVDPETLVEDYGPHLPVPGDRTVGESEGDDDPDDASDPGHAEQPYVRADQEKRAKTAERELAQLGKVNPLALEEYAALEERHQFLTEQLEDLKSTQADLLSIVKEVDDRVQQVFSEAYADVAREFSDVFSRLFPGGEGNLVLTEPDDLLTSGIEVEARPPGKKVKRLSLLSGGERSLVAATFLVALFKARPSPFYILDEVEAALDDTNLGRLLQIYEELRERSQLVVITHQKRTMEIADALYGVSMRGDGVTAVISQRIREAESA
ncbi:MAG TPA: chromosome segregation protein SMC, partial [Jiangellaceae bacterium]|nr:chromosome segregation protein SMC [Jiangellaceae bacterium]